MLVAGRGFERPGVREILRLLPDLLRLLKRLTGDPTLPRGVRVCGCCWFDRPHVGPAATTSFLP
jgi:hypothetical protein